MLNDAAENENWRRTPPTSGRPRTDTRRILGVEVPRDKQALLTHLGLLGLVLLFLVGGWVYANWAPDDAVNVKPGDAGDAPGGAEDEDVYTGILLVFCGSLLFLMTQLGWYFFSWKQWLLANKLRDTPTSPPSAVPIGRAETSGRATLAEGATPVGRDRQAVWYEATLEIQVKNSWKTVWTVRSTQAFLLEDEHGAVKVHLDKAMFHVEPVYAKHKDTELFFGVPAHKFERRHKLTRYGLRTPVILADLDFPSEELLRAAGPGAVTVRGAKPNWDSLRHARLVERAIPLDGQATVYGPVQMDLLGRPEFRGAKRKVVHICSNGAAVAERQIRRLSRFGFLFSGILSSAIVWFGLDMASVMRPGAAALTADGGRSAVDALIEQLYTARDGLAWGVLAALWLPLLVKVFLDVYNRLVAAVNHVESAWSMLDVALARRAELLPQLERVAAEALWRERDTLTMLSRARWSGGKRTELQTGARRGVETRLMETLSALVERHPKLATSENMLDLQREVARSEHLIAGARTGYNDAVEIARNKLQSFPSNLFAWRFSKRRSSLWTC